MRCIRKILMLSISPLKSASGAAKYYLSEENPKDLPDVSLEKRGR
uniref:IncF plasmid conjugative transfer DNA-nicking and unwinding protein TraI n=1 Tax=Vibrio tasmaniensis TaxID=212663 RepID=A0A0H3ZP53_9VIBR|nr:IncF plasmid conjugative transfer DNA-nicking and unwinding protein TraI [Vibrio tasmaniensis]